MNMYQKLIIDTLKCDEAYMDKIFSSLCASDIRFGSSSNAKLVREIKLAHEVIQIQEVGNLFVELLEEVFNPEIMAEIAKRNRMPEYFESCASHDFVDANMTMLSAYCGFFHVNEDDVDLNSIAPFLDMAWFHARSVISSKY